ncbi:site-specific integrase [Streptosporangium sp. CA-135522]|uniref:site-specific integrase n=1 Tax=Streptosporangium sp. CA-135522 TaxID=3240072 RepID=UPI003D8D96A0
MLQGLPSLLELAGVNGTRSGRFFLLGPDGVPDDRVNAFFAAPRIRNRAELTGRKYAVGLGVWLSFLEVLGRTWWEASEDDVAEFKFWRMSDPRNPGRVSGGTVHGNLVAVSSFYQWAERRFGVVNPVNRREIRRDGEVHVGRGYEASPHVIRDSDVKWFDPAGYRRWCEIGLRGFGVDGLEDESWRGRNDQRDCAFADGLYGTGLRLQEWGSVLDLELPPDDPRRGFYTCWLADACAKGGRGRRYWMPRSVLVDVLAYLEGARAAAIRRAQAKGRYERLAGVRLVERLLGNGRLELRTLATGELATVSLDTLRPTARRRLFRQTGRGLEPMAVWLNEDGLPRDHHGWEKTFERANERVAKAGLIGMEATPHRLRHSMALRWYSIGRLSYELRLGHLTSEEMKDFRAQFGDVWQLMQTLLGHSTVTTTMSVYLEPFRSLDVSLLIEHIEGAGMAALLAELLDKHPRVHTDPLRPVR